jgi:hypothetical protein
MSRRALILAHRYLGIAIGLVMLMWFASGIVMLYVPYPALTEHTRVSALEPIRWQACCGSPSHPFGADQPVERVRVESAAGVLIVRFTVPGELETFASIDSSGRALTLDAAQIRAIAAATARRLGVAGATQPATQETIVRDQWTVSGEYNRDRPLILFGFDDPQRTHLYISSRSGRVVLWTTARQRFWNRLGAVPHWIYPTVLRSKVKVWAQVVIWAAVLGVLLTTFGLYLGVVQFRLRGPRPFSPYPGLWYWHHTLGLLFGVFTLTWVVSGLISMNPWGFLDSSPPRPSGPSEHAITWHDIQDSLPRLAASPEASNTVSVVTAPMSGHLFWIVTKQGGTQTRLDATGHAAPVSEQDLQGAAQQLAAPYGVASAMLLQHEDAYYYRHRDPIVLPVYRAILDDEDHSRLYLDPLSGRLLAGFDGDGQWQRWLFDGLHRLDFSAALRASAAWNALIVLLLLGGVAGSGTGVYLAVRRIRLDLAKLIR